MQPAVPDHRPGSTPAPCVPDPTPGAHRQFVELLHGLSGVLWEMDARSWRFTFVSERAERVFGYPVQRWYDEPTFWQDTLLHPEDRDWCVGFCALACARCENHAFLYRARSADGRIVWIRDVVRVIPDETGAPAVMRGVMIDVSEQLPQHGASSFAVDYEADELAELRAVLAA